MTRLTYGRYKRIKPPLNVTFGFGGQFGYYTDLTGLVCCTHCYYDQRTGR